ncbi:hypothetical protein JKF63_02357 [Porcisia hertigi]|uniref:Uncharacterized protein n=1 Tax=Porcisia hertigi TaxID=2761500 RepID=A0A836L5F6_9TRYP|nr:hypothetical protein JKF63_02357 [Porcisia hertigi]
MLRTLFLLGWRIGQPTILRAAPKTSTQATKAAARVACEQQERAAEKQFLRLISKARVQRQRHVANAIRQAVTAKSKKGAAQRNVTVYASNQNIAKAELAAVAREVAERHNKARKMDAASPLPPKTVSTPKRPLAQQEHRNREKKQAAREERFLASLQRRVEKRKARIDALLAKRAKIEEEKARAQAKAQAKVEAAAKAEEKFQDTIRKRQEKRAARVKAIVEGRAKGTAEVDAEAEAEAEDATASAEKLFAEELHRLEKEREKRVQAIIAEHLEADCLLPHQKAADTSAAKPVVAVSQSRKSKKKVKMANVAPLEASDLAPLPATAPTAEVVPVKTEPVEALAGESTTRQTWRRVVSSKSQPHPDEKTTELTEAVEETVATLPEAHEKQTASEVPPSPSEPPQTTTDNAAELKKAHDDVVAQLEKAKERSTASLSSRVSPAPKTWAVHENLTGLFRL